MHKYIKLFLLIVLFFYTILFAQTKQNYLEGYYSKDIKFQAKSFMTAGEKDHLLNMNGNDLKIPANEQQLVVIQNVLLEDFLVNDDTTSGPFQFYPSIAMDS